MSATIVLITWTPQPERLQWAKDTFRCIKENTRYPYKLVVVDNGPPVSTNWWRKQDVEVHIVNEKNRGVGASRNLGAAHADSDYIAFLDDDLYLEPGWLTNCVEAIDLYPDKKLIAKACQSPSHNNTRRGTGEHGHAFYTRGSGHSLVMKRETFELAGPWSETENPDIVLGRRARRAGYRFVHHPDWKSLHVGYKRPCYNRFLAFGRGQG